MEEGNIRSLQLYNEALDYLGLNTAGDFPTPRIEEIQAMKESNWWPDEANLFKSHNGAVRNGVAFSEIAYRDPNQPPLVIDVQLMAAKYSHLGFQWKSSFPSAVWRLGSPDNTMNVTIQIHTSGSLHIAGSCHPNEYFAAVSSLIDVMETQMGYPPLKINKPFNQCNIVVSGQLPGQVRTERLKNNFPDIVQLRRDSFPGASLGLLTSGDRCESKRIVALAFDSPNFVVVGWRKKEDYCRATFPIFYCLWRSRALPRRAIYIDRSAVLPAASSAEDPQAEQSPAKRSRRGNVEVWDGEEEEEEEEGEEDVSKSDEENSSE